MNVATVTTLNEAFAKGQLYLSQMQQEKHTLMEHGHA